MGRPTLFETPHVPDQMRLFGPAETPGEGGWLKALRLDDYALERPAYATASRGVRLAVASRAGPGSIGRGGAVPKGASVPVSLNHTIVFAEDKDESASFFTWLFALPEAESWGPFRIVGLDNDGSVLFAEPGIEIQPQHLAFLVGEDDFDGIYGRIVEAGLEHWPDPRKSTSGTFNTNNGGRGVYLNDPAGHNLEVLTRP